MIKTFYELTRPEQDGAAFGKDWTTYHETTNPAGYYYLRNDGSGYLIDLFALADVEDIYFETEVSCHAAAALYYHHHNEIYPYWQEYADCIKEVRGGNTIPTSTIIRSEEMKF